MPFISSVRGTFGAQSKQLKSPAYLTVSPAINGQSVFRLSDQSLIISTAGEYTITSQYPISFRAKLWGAGGRGAGSGWATSDEAGSGGYATGIIATNATTFTIIVGGAGRSPATTGAGSCTFGGGASSTPPGSNNGDPQYSGGGGGLTGIFTGSSQIHTSSLLSSSPYKLLATQQRSILIAGGGGGGGNTSPAQGSMRGGHGGGSSGTGGWVVGTQYSASAGTQSAVGVESFGGGWGPDLASTRSSYGIPAYMQAGPGTGETYGGGGGGGYFGGSNAGSSSSNGRMAGGGGGSGYFNPSFVSSATLTAGTAYNAPGNSADSAYAFVTPAGQGGTGNRSSSAGNPGYDGAIVITGV
jgi:hypothetical protein